MSIRAMKRGQYFLVLSHMGHWILGEALDRQALTIIISPQQIPTAQMPIGAPEYRQKPAHQY